jgi:hypothetical protein
MFRHCVPADRVHSSSSGGTSRQPDGVGRAVWLHPGSTAATPQLGVLGELPLPFFVYASISGPPLYSVAPALAGGMCAALSAAVVVQPKSDFRES